MTTAIAEREFAAPTVTKEHLDLVKRTVASGATDAELKLYLYDCERRGIHPLDKLLHFTKRGGKYTPVTSIDFMRAQAAMSGEMAGSDDPVFVPTSDGHGIESAMVTVYRLTQGQRFAYSATARWTEYCPEGNAPMWKRMPHTMLGKCAEALALRKAFPQQLAGLYTSDEMDQADRTTPVATTAAVIPPSAPLQPSEPNGGDSAVDIQTGEVVSERPAPPPGYFYIRSYNLSGNGWHEILLIGAGIKGGDRKLSTKNDRGFTAQQAFIDGLPVRCLTSEKPRAIGDEAYLDDIQVWRHEPLAGEDSNNEPPLAELPPLTDADIPF